MKKLIVIGGGGFAKEIVWLARDCGYEVVGVLDDNVQAHSELVANAKIIGVVDDWKKYTDVEFVIAIGSPRTRKTVYEKITQSGKPRFAKLIHPTAIVSPFVNIGEGTIICAGCIVTVDVVIGAHCIFNLNVTIGHDCAISNFTTIAPMVAVSGNVTMGLCVEVGTGASIRQGLTLGSGSMLGMGAVLTKSISECVIFAGNPARRLKEHLAL
ncbi:acetyltransferase [Shewanella colwelliana]|uniref:Acetyltransferase n=1 Tax=Shewanella colwelliana TaxID=23 RepID=A0A1E5IVK3_SHECO|nr:acetyltransferase [Shewanella colwelliana]OEG74526.1 acetyltransferase [Shewanella colwelliana]